MPAAKLKEAKMKKCMHVGHDWAYNPNLNSGCIVAECLRCGVRQCYFPEEVLYVPDLDDDGPEE